MDTEIIVNKCWIMFIINYSIENKNTSIRLMEVI